MNINLQMIKNILLINEEIRKSKERKKKKLWRPTLGIQIKQNKQNFKVTLASLNRNKNSTVCKERTNDVEICSTRRNISELKLGNLFQRSESYGRYALDNSLNCCLAK